MAMEAHPKQAPNFINYVPLIDLKNGRGRINVGKLIGVILGIHWGISSGGIHWGGGGGVLSV